MIINSISFTKSFEYETSSNGDLEPSTITYNFDVFSSSSNSLDPYIKWQETRFIPGVHNVSVALADSFVPGGSFARGFYGFLWYFLYNLLPCVIIITCFGTISWIFKLWN